MRLLVLATVLSLAPAVSTAQAVYGGGFPEEKTKAFQITGGMMIPFLNYSNRVDDIGWNAGAAFILKPRPGFHVRIEGLYNSEVVTAGGTASELQFGTKIGFDVVMGRGKVQPVFNAYWLFTWGSPYISLVPITIGLRF